MITPQEIHKKSQRIYRTRFLKARLSRECIFPLILPAAKGKSTDPLAQRLDELSQLMSREKATLGIGYRVVFREVRTRKNGMQSVPVKILFETETDFLKFIRKEQEVKDFDGNVALLRNRLPQLETWIYNHSRQVVTHDGSWEGLIRVCRYFMDHPQPGLYIRELPIDVHTKFIEKHKGILTSLMEVLLPASRIRTGETRFEKKFGLKYDQDIIRFRLMEATVAGRRTHGLKDLSIPIMDFCSLAVECRRVFIIENKMTFLAFPHVDRSMVIWGKGFAVEQLRQTPWLPDKKIFYWGDIDPHGFEILSGLRRHFPQVQSMMMDKHTFEAYSQFAAAGSLSTSDVPAYLTPEELRMMRWLSDHPETNRLEQEKIPQDYVIRVLSETAL
jgi:hypothetical protein